MDDVETVVGLLAKLGACAGPSFAPDGARLAFISNLSGLPQLWTVATAGGWPEQVTALDDPVVEAAWSPDGAWLALGVAPGGGMNRQLYLVRPDGTELRRLTPGGAENNWLGPWTHDGRALPLSSNRDDPHGMDVYLLDVATEEWQLVARNPGIGQIRAVSRDGNAVVVSRVLGRGDNNLILVDRASGAEQVLTPHTGPGSFGGGKLSPDGRTVYLSSDRERELAAFARVQLDEAGAPGPIELLAERDDAELESFALSDDGAMAALVWNVAGQSELELFDVTTGARRPVALPPGVVVVGPTFAPDGRQLAFAATGATRPVDVWVVDSTTATPRQLTHSPHAGIALDRLVAPELVRFPAHDGLPLTAWLYRPPAASGPGPIVLSFHGGPEAQERPFINATYQALLAQGIAVLAPNVRGSSGFGKRFVNLDNGALRFDAVKDIQSCADYVVDAGIAAPGRIGIMGGSYGGYMTMAGLVEYPDLFAAGANLFGVVNFETFFAHTEPWMAAVSTTKYGDPVTERDLLRRLSPIHRLDRVRGATLVLHGANDTNVPVVEAEQVVTQLRERGATVDYILFPDEGHGFVKVANRITATSAIVQWFRRYLGVDPKATNE